MLQARRIVVHATWLGLISLAVASAVVGAEFQTPGLERLPPVAQSPITIGSQWTAAQPGAGDAPTAWASDVPHLDVGPPGLSIADVEQYSWDWRVLPDGLLYRSYLAGAKEPRMAGVWGYERSQGSLGDIALGGRAGVLRYGTDDLVRPEGYQLDIEGVAFPRLDLQEERDVVSADFRFGVPLTYRTGRFESKFGYYHISSHLGDEFLLKNPGVTRYNYVRENLILGFAWWQSPWMRLYTELGYAFSSDVALPWELQFGVDHAPPGPTGQRGAPFWAVNGHLREEVDFSGNFVAQVGWAWRGGPTGHLFRAGFEYVTGKSTQFEFFNQHEERLGFGLWFDF